jgi:hypothetical protein
VLAIFSQLLIVLTEQLQAQLFLVHTSSPTQMNQISEEFRSVLLISGKIRNDGCCQNSKFKSIQQNA